MRRNKHPQPCGLALQEADQPAARTATVRETVKQTTRVRLRADRTAEAVFHMVAHVFDQITLLVEQSPGRATHACTAGCCFCCYLPVDVTAPEALVIAAYLRTTCSPEAFGTTRAQVAATAAQVGVLSFEEHTQAKIPCALLVNGRCSVYPHRPFACRAWNSTSVDRCETMFRDDPLTRIPLLDIEVYDAAWCIARGMADGVRLANLNGNTYELHSILLRALDTPDAAQHWVRGKSVFAECAAGAFTQS